MQICTLTQTHNHTSIPPLSFLHAGCPSCRPSNSIKALKAMLTNIANIAVGLNRRLASMSKFLPYASPRSRLCCLCLCLASPCKASQIPRSCLGLKFSASCFALSSNKLPCVHLCLKLTVSSESQ